MKKQSRFTPLITAFGLAMLCMAFVASLVQTADLLSVHADQATAVSPSALSGETVSPTSSPAVSRAVSSKLFARGALFGLLGNSAPPETIPVTVTHNVTVGGSTYGTAVPAGASIEGTAQLCNLTGDPAVTENEHPFSVKEVSSSYSSNYGKSLRLSVPTSLANGATVTATLSDNSTVTWNGIAAVRDGDNTVYDFLWDTLAPGLGDNNVASLSVNLPYRVAVQQLTVTGDSESSLVLTAEDASSAWNLLYTDNAADISAAQTSASADSSHTITAYAADGGSFLLTESDETRKITSVTGVTAESVNDYTYRVTMPSSAASINVTTGEIPVRMLTVEATSPDYSMNGVTVMDSTVEGTAHNASQAFRYQNDTATTSYSSGVGGKTGKGTVTFSNYYRMPHQDWWVSLVPYLETSVPNISRTEYTNDAESFLEISNVKFYDADNNVITSSVDYRTGWKHHSPYVQFRPQDKDMRVTFDVTLSPNFHKVYLHISRHSTDDTIYSQRFDCPDGSVILQTGSSSSAPSEITGNVSCGGHDKYDQPYLFDITSKDSYDKLLGYFHKNSPYLFTLKRENSPGYGASTAIRSVNIYGSDAAGNATGSPVNASVGFVSVPYDESEYDTIEKNDNGSNKLPYTQVSFTMPDYDIVVVADYANTIGTWNITQQVINADGSVSDATDEFSAVFSGSPRASDSKGPFYESGSQTVTGASGKFGRYKGVDDITFTTSAPNGYRVAYVQCLTGFKSHDLSSYVKRTGDTGDGKEQFAFANRENSSNSILSYYGEQYGATLGNGVGYNITIQYTKISTIHLTQRTDATIPTNSTAAIGTVTFTSDNGGSFIDASSGTLSQSLPETLTKSTQTCDVYASDGNQTRFTVDVNDSGHVLSGVRVYRNLDGGTEDIPFTTVSTSTTKGVYTINSALAAGGEICIDVDYIAATRLSLDIKMKTSGDFGSNTAFSNDVHATVTVTGQGATTPDYQFQSATDSTTCNSFTVTDKNVGKYITVGNTKLSIQVSGVTEGYTVANVILYEMNASTGAPNTSKELEGLTPTSQTVSGYGECRSYLSSSYTMAGTNVYIRVILARTVKVNVKFQSRDDTDGSLFGANTRDSADVSVTPSANTSAYGKSVMPVIVLDQSSTGFSTTAIKFSADPAERTVYLLEKTKLTGTVSVPDGYIVTGVTATRVNTTTNAEETMAVNLSGKFVSVGSDVFYQPTYMLRKNSSDHYVDYGYDYDVTVQYEKAASVRFAVYHNDAEGNYTTKTVSGNTSEATLSGTRSTTDAGDTPYNGAAYQSATPFLIRPKNLGTANCISSKKIKVNDSTSDRVITLYALRHTDLTFSVTPKGDDELAFIKVFNVHDPAVTYEYTLVSESGGTQQYSVSQRTDMAAPIAIEVYFKDKKTVGEIKIINQDIFGNPLSLKGSGAYSQLSVVKAPYATPGYDVQAGEPFANVDVTDPSREFTALTGSKATFKATGSTAYIIDSYKVSVNGEEETYAVSSVYTTYSKELTVAQGADITVTNIFVPAAQVQGRVQYLDETYDGEYTAKQRFNNESAYKAIELTDVLHNGNEAVRTDTFTVTSSAAKTVGAGDTVTLKITEKAGYVLHRLELSCSDAAGKFSKVYSRADITATAPSETGDITLTVPLPEGFAGFEAGGNYRIYADFIADYVHVSAYSASQDEFGNLLDTGVYDYDWSRLEYLDPRGTVNAGQYSVDGAKDKKYYDDNHASMGVRDGSTPSFTVNPLYNSETRTHYRIGMVLYGDTMTTQDQNRVRIAAPPLANDQTLALNFTKPVTGDRYITIVYVTLTDDEAVKPKVYTPYDTEIGNAVLTVNLFLLNDDTNEYNLINDANASVLNTIKVDLTASQKCVGYANQDSDGSNVSNRDHHANYQVEGETPVIYHHDDSPTVQRYDETSSSWNTVIGALANDADYPVGSRNIAADSSYRMTTGSTRFAVKYNTVDAIDALLTTDIGEEYLLQRMVITDTTAGTSETKEFTGSQSIASTYRYKTDHHNRTVNYYFRRVVMELGTNHQEGVEKGSVKYIVGDGEAIAIAASDHNQACKISVGKPIQLKIKPSSGYRLFGVWAGDSIDSQAPVQGASGPDENGEITVNLGAQYKTLYVNVRFAPLNVAGISQMVLRQYMVDADNNVTPITTGKVLAVGIGTQDKPFGASGSVTLENAQSLETDVYENTEITFSLTPPPDGAVKEVRASMQGASESTKTPLGVTNIGSNTFKLDEKTVGDKILYVDAYFSPTYTLHYDGNGGKGQAPGDVPGKKTTETVTLAGQNTLNRDGFTFKGWSLSSDNNQDTIISSVTFANANITVYAVWEAQSTYTVTYQKGSAGDVTGDAPTDPSSPYFPNSEVTVLGNGTLARPNHAFLGWSETDNSTAATYSAGDTFSITKNTVLYPVWGTPYAVTYEKGGAESVTGEPPVDANLYPLNGRVTVLGSGSLARTGFVFLGWTETDGSDTAEYIRNQVFAITRNMVLYPVWKTAPSSETSVTIRYTSGLRPADMDDPSLRNERTDSFTVGGDYTVRPNDGWTDFRRGGYRFKGWRVASVDTGYPSSGGASAVLPVSGGTSLSAYWQKHSFWNPGDVMPALDENISLVAVWERLYQVKYDGNGNTEGQAPFDGNAYPDQSSVSVLNQNTLKKSGFLFAGWNTAQDGSGQRYQPEDTLVIHGGDVTLYAQWVEPASQDTDSPGTGDGAAGSFIAFLTAVSSSVALTYCIRRRRRFSDSQKT